MKKIVCALLLINQVTWSATIEQLEEIKTLLKTVMESTEIDELLMVVKGLKYDSETTIEFLNVGLEVEKKFLDNSYQQKFCSKEVVKKYLILAGATLNLDFSKESLEVQLVKQIDEDITNQNFTSIGMKELKAQFKNFKPPWSYENNLRASAILYFYRIYFSHLYDIVVEEPYQRYAAKANMTMRRLKKWFLT